VTSSQNDLPRASQPIKIDSMRKVSIKQLDKALSVELKDLPFEVTYYGKTVAVVVKGPEVSKGKGPDLLTERNKAEVIKKLSTKIDSMSDPFFKPLSKDSQLSKKKKKQR